MRKLVELLLAVPEKDLILLSNSSYDGTIFPNGFENDS